MAAYEASIFQTMEKAKEQLHNAFLEAVVQELHVTSGLFASIFHSLHLVEPGASFLKKLLNDDENVRFSSWLGSSYKNIAAHFNTILSQNRILPKDITSSDFEDFMRLKNNKAIINYIIKDGTRSFIAAYAVTEELASTMHSKRAAAIRCIESFCESSGLDTETFKNYIKLSSLSRKSLNSNVSSLNQKSVTLTAEELAKFEDCKKIIQPIMEMDKESVEIAKIQNYDEVIQAVNAMRSFHSIQKYESMVTELATNFEFVPEQTRRIIAICGYGLTKPYIPMMTLEEFTEFSLQEQNLFSQIRHEVYYRVADKKMAAVNSEPNIRVLMMVKLRLEYIVKVIELASYDTNFFNGEKINYAFNAQPQEKYIPPLLYSYYVELKRLAHAADSEQNVDDYLKNLDQTILRFQLQLNDDSIHSKWHQIFLIQLYNMVNPPIEKDKKTELELSAKSERMLSSQSSYTGSPSLFYREKTNNGVSNTPPPSAAENDSSNGLSKSLRRSSSD